MQLAGWVIWGVMALAAISFIIHFIFYLVRLFKTKSGSSWIFEHAIITFIVLILAAIAIPNFLKFQAKAKGHEAKTYLGAIYLAQTAYYSQAGTYPAGPNAFELMNWKPPGGTRYAYYCDTAVIANKLPMGREMPLPDMDWPVKLKPRSSRTGFTCMAVGNVDNDPDLDVWSINDAKVLTNEQNDV